MSVDNLSCYEDNLMIKKLDKNSMFTFFDNDYKVPDYKDIEDFLDSICVKNVLDISETIKRLDEIKETSVFSLLQNERLKKGNYYPFMYYSNNGKRLSKEDAEKRMMKDFLEVSSSAFDYNCAIQDKEDYKILQERMRLVCYSDNYKKTIESLSRYFYLKRIDYTKLSPLEIYFLVDLGIYFIYNYNFLYCSKRNFCKRLVNCYLSYVDYFYDVLDSLMNFCNNNVYKVILLMSTIVDYLQNEQFNNSDDKPYSYQPQIINGYFFKILERNARKFSDKKFDNFFFAIDFSSIIKAIDSLDKRIFQNVDMETLLNLYIKTSLIPVEVNVPRDVTFHVAYKDNMCKVLDTMTINSD